LDIQEKDGIYIIEFKGQKFYFYKTPHAKALIEEIFADNYRVFAAALEFNEGDIVIDIGACEGMFSIMMGKIFPQTKIIAFEPVIKTYYNMVRNIGLNGVTNIRQYNLAIGKAEERIQVVTNKNELTGGSSAKVIFNPENHSLETVEVIPLNKVITDFNIQKVKLLKVDVEGMEYDIFYHFDHMDKIEYVTAELHTNFRIETENYRIQALASWLENKTKILNLEFCKMSD
jgi:FkbM family methyltransferase